MRLKETRLLICRQKQFLKRASGGKSAPTSIDSNGQKYGLSMYRFILLTVILQPPVKKYKYTVIEIWVLNLIKSFSLNISEFNVVSMSLGY